jgi:hypothetical protein
VPPPNELVLFPGYRTVAETSLKSTLNQFGFATLGLARRGHCTHLMPSVKLRENPFEARVTPEEPMLMLLSLRLGGRTY